MRINIKEIKDISIKEYREILTIIECGNDSIENNVKIISLLTDITEKDLLDYDYNSIIKLVEIVEGIIGKEASKDINEVEIDGIKYDFDKRLDKMTTGMFIDLYNFTKDGETIIDNLHIISAILFREKKNGRLNKYDSEDVMARADIFNEKLSVSVAQNICFFFLILRMKLLEKIVAFLENKLKQEKVNMK